jgi:hypothetical protein
MSIALILIEAQNDRRDDLASRLWLFVTSQANPRSGGATYGFFTTSFHPALGGRRVALVAVAESSMRQDLITRCARFALLIAVAGGVTLMLGPYQGAEHVFFLTDKEAHTLAFYLLTTLAFLAAPKMRKNDLAMAAVFLAAAVEASQGLTGRQGSGGDLLASALGAGMAWAAATAEGLRRRARKKVLNRRRRRATAVGAASADWGADGYAPSQQPADTPPVTVRARSRRPMAVHPLSR